MRIVSILFLISVAIAKQLNCNQDYLKDPHVNTTDFHYCCHKTNDSSYEIAASKFNNHADACKCSQFLELDSMFNYWDINYCQSRKILKTKHWSSITIIGWIPVGLLLFSLIASTADVFFVPTLDGLSNVLNLSPSVSGATLIALANGAPDFFCSIAGMSGDQQPGLIIGGLIGSAALTSVLIFGIVITVAPYQSKQRLFLRDTLFLLFVIALFGIAIHCHTIHVCVGWIMFAVYGIYVLIVIFSKEITKKAPNNLRKWMTKTHLFDPRFRKHSLVINHKRTESLNSQIRSDSMSELRDTAVGVVRELDITSDEDDSDENNKVTVTVAPTNTVENGEVTKDGGDLSELVLVKVSYSLWNYVHYVLDWDEQSCFGKCLYVFESPFLLLRMLSIPMLVSEESLYFPGLVTLSLILSPTLIIFSFIKAFLLPPTVIVHIPVYLASILFGLLCYLLLLPTQNAPRNKCVRGFIFALAMVCCASWIMLFANELLALLDVIGTAMGMSQESAGITFLAMGNSVPDLMVNVAAAKNGDNQASVTACFAGAIFNILCSFGIAIVFSGFEGMEVNGGLKYTFTYSFVVIGLLFVILKSVSANYYLGKSTGVIAICWYAIFLFFVIWGGFQSLNPPFWILNE